METKKKIEFLCRKCGKNDTETKFYDYLKSQCISCKINHVKDSRSNKFKENTEDKIRENLFNDSVGVYLINIGKVNDLKDKFIINENYNDEYYIYKFGLTSNMNARLATHKANFSRLGCNINLEFFNDVSKGIDIYCCENIVKLMFSCEDFCPEFVEKDYFENTYRELVIFNMNDLYKVKHFYNHLNDKIFISEYFNSRIFVKEYNTNHYLCNGCLDTNPQNFYPYLNTKCIKCKRKCINERKSDIISDKRTKKLNELDPDGKIRSILEEYELETNPNSKNNTLGKFIKDLNTEVKELRTDIYNLDCIVKKQNDTINKLLEIVSKLHS